MCLRSMLPNKRSHSNEKPRLTATRKNCTAMKMQHVCVHAKSPQSCLTLCNPMNSSQVPLSIGFSRQECWSGLWCPPPRDLLNPGIEPRPPASPVLQVDSLPTEPPGKPPILWYVSVIHSFYDRIIFHCMGIPICLSINQLTDNWVLPLFGYFVFFFILLKYSWFTMLC